MKTSKTIRLKKILSSKKYFFLKQESLLVTKIFLLIIILIKPILSFSQTTNPQTLLPNVFPVNPKAFEFIKYSEIPVSKYTGIPSISIPIFTIKTNSINVPISLNYHSNGFRVSEESGWTGLGWTLDAGGSIVQVVNGFDDFGWYRNRDNEAQAMVDASTGGMPHSILNTCTTVNFRVLSGVWPPSLYGAIDFDENKSLLEDGFKDLEPDVFKFNMLGYSGEFILDWEHEIFKCLSDKNIKIESVDYSNTGANTDVHPNEFIITSPDGNKFTFTVKEQTRISGIIRKTSAPNHQRLESLNIIGQKSCRVYQLSNISTIGGDIITFNYIETGLLENLPAISTFGDYYSFSGHHFGGRLISDIFVDNYGDIINYSQQSLSYLSSIDFPDGKLVFNSTNNRIDYVGMRKLNSIILQDKNNTTVKSFDFLYDYFIGHTSGSNNDIYLTQPSYDTHKVQSELTHRLKLLSVKESDKPAYFFEYDQEPLPKKTSLAYDSWGYYHGVANGASWGGQQAAVLKKITYPTGGTSTFDYELNSFDNYSAPVEVTTTVTPIRIFDRNNQYDSCVKVFMADATSYLQNGTLSINTCGPKIASTNESSAYIRLTVLKKTAYMVDLITNGGSAFWPVYYPNLGHMGGALINESDIVYDQKILKFGFSYTTGYETFKLLEDFSIIIKPENIYIVQAFLNDNFDPQTNQTLCANASADFTYIKNTPIIPADDLSHGVGLRIKTIKTQDPTSTSVSTPLIKSYKYFGGKLMSPKVNYMKSSITYAYGFTSTDANGLYPIFGRNDFLVTKTSSNSSSFYPVSTSASGKYVGYDEVEESNSTEVSGDILNNANGKVLDSFTNTPDVGVMDLSATNGVNPLGFFYPARKAPIQNGLILGTKVFDKDQTLIESTGNYYYPTSSNCAYGRVQAFTEQIVVPLQSGQFNEYSIYSVGFYPISSNKTLLGSSSKTVYSGNDSITTSQSYTYDSHDQLSKTTQIDSKNNTINTFYKYPYDFYDYSGYYTMVQQDNIIAPVIEKRIEINSTPISTIRDVYSSRMGYAIPRVYLKSKTLSSYGGPGDLVDEVVYDLYSDGANIDKFKLKQYHDRSGIFTSLVWGYSGQYPISETKNATTSECDYTGFENQAALGWTTNGWNYTDISDYVKTGRSAITGIGSGPTKTYNVGLAANSHSGYKASAWIMGGSDAYIQIEVVDLSMSKRIVRNPNKPGAYNLVEVELPYSLYKNNITSTMQIKCSIGSSGTAYFDDLRFYPMDAQMTTYTYDPLIGVTSVSDVNNKPTIYKYDLFNRLSYIKDFQGNILKKYDYHYKP